MRCLIAAGGTGGHVFPALSVAAVLQKKDPGGRFLFVGTRGGLESRTVPARGFPLRTIHAAGLMGLGWGRQLRTLLGLPRTAFQCLSVLATFRPHLVLGMGGYTAGPVVLLAALLGIPTAIAEQNALAGRTNRVLGRFVKRVFLSFSESAGAFPTGKVRVTGNPIRPELLNGAREISPPRWERDSDETFHLLVFGGSQGALGINQGMIEALPLLRDLPFPVEVLHQAGSRQVEELRQAYATAEITHRVLPFIEEMDKAYRWAHLVVCRAGATSLGEITLFKRPSVLIPFPYATDDHQGRNAQVLESAGAAILLREDDLNGERLAGTIGKLGGDPALLYRMGAKAGQLARPEAADLIADECLALASRGRSVSQPSEEATP